MPLLLLFAVLIFPAVAEAGGGEGGVLILHYNPLLAYSTESPGPGSSELIRCADGVTEMAQGDSGTVFVLAAFPEHSTPRIAGVSFGVRYDPASAVLIGGPMGEQWVEAADPGWPGNGTGTSLVWMGALTSRLQEIYWFGVHSISQGTLELTPHPNPLIGGQFLDDAVPPAADEIAGYGILGFGQQGWSPCVVSDPAGACCSSAGECFLQTEVECAFFGAGYRFLGVDSSCLPNLCLTPADRLSWGRVKSRYRDATR